MARWAIGDVHGCARTLDALLARLGLRPEDEVVFVGDYVDRGPDSFGVIERVIRMQADGAAGRGPRTVALRGNHDQMMLDYVDGTGHYELWRANGGLTTLDSYARAGHDQIPEAHVAFLRATPLVHDTPEAVYVHAGLDPHRSVAEQIVTPDPDVVMWTRNHLNASLEAWEKPVVCGHTPVPEPLDEPHLIDVDTGAVFAGRRPDLGWLTAVEMPNRRFVSVPYTG